MVGHALRENAHRRKKEKGKLWNATRVEAAGNRLARNGNVSWGNG